MMELSRIIGAVFIIYGSIMLWIGYTASRSTYSSVDFFLANRSLKAWVTAISSTASSESAWAVLGTVGLAYKDGLSALWFFPGCLLGYMLNWFFINTKITDLVLMDEVNMRMATMAWHAIPADGPLRRPVACRCFFARTIGTASPT